MLVIMRMIPRTRKIIRIPETVETMRQASRDKRTLKMEKGGDTKSKTKTEKVSNYKLFFTSALTLFFTEGS